MFWRATKYAKSLGCDALHPYFLFVTEKYVKEATSIQQMNREGGYGYFIWKYRDGFSINGKWKQKCYVLPKEELVITYLSHIEEDTPDLKESMEKHILGIT